MEQTIVDLFNTHLVRFPNKTIYRFLTNGEEETASRTFQQLYERSKVIASHILEKATPGDRVLLLYPSGLDFTDAFFGCLLAGVIAVPAFPPQGKRRIGRLETIVADCNATLIITTDEVYKKCHSWFSDEVFSEVKWLQTNVLTTIKEVSKNVEITAQTIAFLQYTSGSTGDPKGVMVTHQNILHNTKLIQDSFRLSPKSIGVTWLPIYHDMGLIGNILEALCVGFELIIMSPTSFIQKPIRWLQTISDYKATYSGGPNFSYDLCVNQIQEEQLKELDISGWKSAFNGSEPIRLETLHRFVDKFEKVGFKEKALFPCYGMAETTLVVSSSKYTSVPNMLYLEKDKFHQGIISIHREEKKTNQIGFVGNGPVLGDLKVKIVNPETRQVCKKGEIGEIWVAGKSIAKGYWNREKLSQEIFLATTVYANGKENTKAGTFLRTGDMGFFHEGELFVSGRLKEVMIFNGANYYPQDIEKTIQEAHPDLQNNAGAAFETVIDGVAQLVIVQEVKRTSMRNYNFKEIVKSICDSVFQEHELGVYGILMVKPGRVSKTSSGKIQRVGAKRAYEAGEIDGVLESWDKKTVYRTTETNEISPRAEVKNTRKISNTHITLWLQKTISTELQIPENKIYPTTSFSELGMSSVQMIRLSGMLSAYVEKEISPASLYSYSTIEELSNYLFPESKEESSIVAETTSHKEPIAIISMAGRFPGATSIEEFWKNLKTGKDAIVEVPKDRWDANTFYSDQEDFGGDKMNTRWGGFLSEVDTFDAGFFNISPREANNMDPQQRMLLELSNELIERSGYLPKGFKNSKTGVFIGIVHSDYGALLKDSEKDIYSGTGVALSIAANRISYQFGLNGPSMAIDTACSSSLVGVHMAAQSLRNGECSMAIAGGVNLILSPEPTVALSQSNMMAIDGRCKTFDNTANGYVRSEGGGLVLLKRLSAALEDKDTILGVIKGSAINQDGKSNGLTAPNGLAQEQVIQEALKVADVAPETVSYIESHGTGTSLGDPIEIEALHNTYRNGIKKEAPLVVGSVKANIGHLESAAGIAGLIKTVLCFQQQEIPKQLHYQTPNHHINWERMNIQIPNAIIPWKKNEGSRRRAGVSSFGFGGTNAHIILEEAPEVTNHLSIESDINNRAVTILPVAAKEAKAVSQQLQQLAKYVENNPDIELKELAYNLATRRTQYHTRTSIVCRDKEAFLSAIKKADYIVESSDPKYPVKTAFLFTGQGAQYFEMGKKLYETEPVFTATLNTCIKVLNPYLSKDLYSLLFKEKEEIHQTVYTQPALFAIGYSLAKLWESWGASPEAVMGHSVGEITAACIAGIFSLEDGAKLICHRARLMQDIQEKGAMVSLHHSHREVIKYLDSYPRVSIAAINSPNHTVISGAEKEIAALCEVFTDQQIKYKYLKVSHAFHSPLMNPMLAEFEKIAATITYHRPNCKLIGNINGELVDAEITTPSYWVNHISAPVDFLKGMLTLEKIGIDAYIEMGPHPVLTTKGSQCVHDSTKAIWLASMIKGKEENTQLLECLSEWYLCGGNVQWDQVFINRETRTITIPTYPFQRKRFWAIPLTKKEQNIPIAITTTSEKKQPMSSSTSTIFKEIEAYLRKTISATLQMDQDEILLDKSLLDFGADSLVLLEVTKKIEKQYKIKIPIRRVFEDLSNLNNIIRFIIEEKGLLEEETSVTATVPLVTSESSIKPIETTPSISSQNTILQENNGLDSLLHQFSNQNSLLSKHISEQNEILSRYIQSSSGLEGVKAAQPVVMSDKKIVATPKNKSGSTSKEVVLPGGGGSVDIFFQKLPDNQEKQLPKLIEAYTTKTAKSKAYTAKYRDVHAEYLSSAGFRMSVKEMVYPIISESAHGARFIDIDGNEYIDITMGYGSCIFGHQPDFIVNAIKTQLDKGINIGPMNELSGEVASLVSELTGLERVCLANTGTEAVSFAMRLARTVTQKNKIVIFSGSYHGHLDGVLGIQGDEQTDPMVPGITHNMVEDIIVLNYYDEDMLDQIRAHKDELAAIMVEPVRSRFPEFQPKEILTALRELATALQVPLIFDEMVTGFRIGPGGAQEYFGIKADIVTYGKIAGGGMPIGIVAGAAKYLDVVDGGVWKYGDTSYPETTKTLVAGTFARHPLAMAASKAVLEKIKEFGYQAYVALNQKADDLMNRINEFFKKEDIPVEAVNFGSLFRFKFRGNFELFKYHMIAKGVYAWAANNLFINFAHDDSDLEKIYRCVCESAYMVYKSDGTEDYVFPEEVAVEEEKIMAFDMTLAQKQLYLLHEIHQENSLAYTQTFSLELTGNVSFTALKMAVNELAEDHWILKSKVAPGGEQFIIDKTVKIPITKVDLSETEDTFEIAFQKLVDESLATPFSFEEGPLVRLSFIKQNKQKHILLISIHHIIADGWSCSLFLKGISENYNAIALGKRKQKKQYIQFNAYASWLEREKETEEWQGHEQYLLDTFSAKQCKVSLFSGEKNNGEGSHQSHSREICISSLEMETVKKWSQQNGVTLFMTLLSAFEILLLKLTGQSELVMGIPVGGRDMEGVENSIGYYSHIMPLATSYDKEQTIKTYQQELKKRLFEAYDHQTYPYAEFLKLLQDKGYDATDNIINVLFNFDVGLNALEMDGLAVNIHEHKPLYANFDLAINTLEKFGNFHITLDYKTSFLSDVLAEEMLQSFQHLVYEITKKAEEKLSTLTLISEQQEARILNDFSLSKDIYPIGNLVLEEFTKRVIENPEAVAVVYKDIELTYHQLDEQSNQLAHYLRKNNVVSGELIGMMMSRSPELLVSIFGVLKSGAGYVPIDPGLPQERKEYIIKDAQVKMILTDQEEPIPYMKDSDVREISVQRDKKDIENESRNPLAQTIQPSDIAYVIYTSGSTGNPKGVVLEHGHLSNTILPQVKKFGISPEDACLQFASPSFDASVWEIFITLSGGATLYIIEEEAKADTELFSDFIERHQISWATLPPSFFKLLDTDKIVGIKTIITAGEQADIEKSAQYVKGGGIFFNAYGPTETTICATVFDGAIMSSGVPIGRPIANTKAYILNENLEILPTGAVGELCVSGAGIAREYLNQEELTAERFLPNPFSEGERMYRTGDYARWLPDGTIAFVGRMDNQVKIRGYRIELGEIENAIDQLTEVINACVIAKEGSNGQYNLIAYVVGQNFDKKIAQQQLQEKLPAYMIPAIWIIVKEMPLNTSGKIDKKALPEPDVSTFSGSEYIAATTETEQELTRIWQDLLGVEKIGVRDNFFELGGNSLIATRLVAALRTTFEIEIYIKDIFVSRTIEELAAYVDAFREENKTSEEEYAVTINL